MHPNIHGGWEPSEQVGEMRDGEAEAEGEKSVRLHANLTTRPSRALQQTIDVDTAIHRLAAPHDCVGRVGLGAQ